MKLAVVLTTADPEKAWSALRLANHSVEAGDEVQLFLIGEGVEAIEVSEKQFNVQNLIGEFAARGGTLRACGTCLNRRDGEVPEIYEVSAMADLRQMIADAERVISF